MAFQASSLLFSLHFSLHFRKEEETRSKRVSGTHNCIALNCDFEEVLFQTSPDYHIIFAGHISWILDLLGEIFSFFFFFLYARQKLRIAKQYQGTQCGGALLRTTRRRTEDTTLETEKRHGDTETYKALPRKDIFRTLSVVERNASK